MLSFLQTNKNKNALYTHQLFSPTSAGLSYHVQVSTSAGLSYHVQISYPRVRPHWGPLANPPGARGRGPGGQGLSDSRAGAVTGDKQ